MRIQFVLLLLVGFSSEAFSQIVEAGRVGPDGKMTKDFAEVRGSNFSIESVFGGSAFLSGIDPTEEHTLITLLASPEICRELELSDDQVSSVQRCLREMRKIRRGRLRTLDHLPTDSSERHTAMIETIRQQKSFRTEVLDEVLLPEQKVRLKELAWRIETGINGLGASLAGGRLGELLEVSEQTYGNILRTSETAMQEARDEIEAALSKAESKVLRSLPPEKRKLARQTLGDFFLFAPPQPGRELLDEFLREDLEDKQ